MLGVADNKEVTLIGCHPKNSITYGFSSDGPSKQTVSAVTALVGVHLESTDQAVFTQCRVSVENLGLWAASSVFTQSVGFDGERLSGSGSISVSPVDEPSVTVAGTKITLAHEHTLPFFDEQRGQTVGRMRDTAFVRFQPEAPYTLTEAQEQARAVQDLVSLATHRAAGLLWLRLRMPPEDREYPEGYPIHDREVAFLAQVTALGDADAKAVAQHETLFTCRDLPFEEVMPRWLQVRQTHQAAANMALGLRYAPARYIEGNLLTAVGPLRSSTERWTLIRPACPSPTSKHCEMRSWK